MPVGANIQLAGWAQDARETEDRPSVDEAMSRDDTVAGYHMVLHAEIATAMRDELVDFLEGAGVEQELDALARRQLARGVLAAEALLAATELCTLLEVCQGVEGIRHQALTAWAFSQSFRNFSSPMLVSGWLNS